MATVKFKFRASTVSAKQGTLFVQVIHKRVARQVSTKYKLYPNEWDDGRQAVVIAKDASPDRISYLHALQEDVRRDASRLQLVVLALDHSRKDYRAEDVVRRFLKKEQSGDFMAFAERLVGSLREAGHQSLAGKYQTSIGSFNRFLGGRQVTFDDVDASLMLSYETYLKHLGLCPNTTSFYMRNLRAIYNHAVVQDLTLQHHPFSRVYTGIAKSQNVPIAAISEAMGHTSERTTLIYLKSFGNALVDCANHKVLSAIAKDAAHPKSRKTKKNKTC